MFGGSQMQPQQPQPQSIDASTADEEALKSNTDCVYFLASPLTCKKGAECEYRHSEIARVNPRDCWYWLNGNCLNPKCAFRHPPLDGKLVPQVLTTPVSSLPPLQSAATPFSTAHHNSGKQSVPCIFFQKGFCLKGDKCPFLHGPVPVNSKATQGPATTAFLEPSTIKKPVGGLEKCSVEPKAQEVNIPKATKVPLPAKPLSQGETTAPKDLSAIERHGSHPFASASDDYPAKFRQMTPPVANGDSIGRQIHGPPVHLSDNHDMLNSKDADEFSREPSPGFDVLVDDELRDTDYYHDEDHYERTMANEERNLNPVNDYDISHSVDYNSMVDVDQDAYRDPRRYDSFDQMRGRQYGRDQPRVISERISGGPERRRNSRDDSSDHIDGFDLRYHLSKHRKVNNGMRSVLSHDLEEDHHGGDRSYRGPSQRDPQHLPASGRAFSNRLSGRIKLPGRSMSPYNGRDLLREREPERRNNFGHQGRLQHRLKGRVHEDFNNEGRGLRVPQMGDRSYDSTTDFAGPKSLAELRGRKTTDSGKQPMNDFQQVAPLRKWKYMESHQQSECELSFEGPKPLSEILKRKRAADGNGENSKWKEERESLKGVPGYGAGISSVVLKEEREDSKSVDGQRSKGHVEEGLFVGKDAIQDQEPEAYAEGDEEGDDGESEYDQVEGEEYYNEDRAENAEAEFVEDDDGDDFAKKIGVMFS